MIGYTRLKQMIDYLAEHYPECLDEYVAGEHDQIFLPMPDIRNVDVDSKSRLYGKMEELHFIRQMYGLAAQAAAGGI